MRRFVLRMRSCFKLNTCTCTCTVPNVLLLQDFTRGSVIMITTPFGAFLCPHPSDLISRRRNARSFPQTPGLPTLIHLSNGPTLPATLCSRTVAAHTLTRSHEPQSDKSALRALARGTAHQAHASLGTSSTLSQLSFCTNSRAHTRARRAKDAHPTRKE